MLFPPSHKGALHDAILDEILQERVVSSRNRVNFRGVKRKMSNYGVKRPEHRHWPQPSRTADQAVRVLGA